MYDAQYYRNLTTTQIMQRITEEGFDPIQIRDMPGRIYPPHEHAETKLLAFLQGGMQVKVAGQTFNCKAGDRLLIPGNVEHSAIVMSEGCVYFWSEKML